MRAQTRLAVAFLCTFLLLPATPGAEEIPGTLGYSGFLSEEDGAVDRRVEIRVGLFRAPAPIREEQALWEETHLEVEVSSGTFSLSLGEHTLLDPTLFDGRPLFIEFTVDGETLAPRAPIEAVPYAFRAGFAELDRKSVV
jgi:hypothetical protein